MMAFPTLHDLPIELLDIIISHLSHNSVKVLSRVNKLLRNTLSPRLFRTINVDLSTKALKDLDHLVRSPVWHCVEEIIYQPTVPLVSGMLQAQSEYGFTVLIMVQGLLTLLNLSLAMSQKNAMAIVGLWESGQGIPTYSS